MTRPGVRLRALFARWCSEKAMRQRVDPAIADLQAEYAQAGREGRTWRRRWALVAGYAALARLSAYCAWQGLGDAVEECTAGDLRALGRLVLACGFVTTAITALVMWNASARMDAVITAANPTALLFLVPSSLAYALPLGVLFGTGWGLGRNATRSLRLAVGALAVAASLVTLVNVGWVTPAANQSFRTEVFAAAGGQGDVPKGVNELTFPEVRQRDRRSYYYRWGIGLSPMLFALVAVSGRRLVLTRRASA